MGPQEPGMGGMPGMMGSASGGMPPRGLSGSLSGDNAAFDHMLAAAAGHGMIPPGGMPNGHGQPGLDDG
jgi:hypothetical protein